jgi:mycofactocin precursor
MDDTATIAATDQPSHDADTELLEDELLVEEISIDGMCGVY